MKFIRASSKQLQAIKNLSYNRHNINRILKTLEGLHKETLFELSIDEARKLISELLKGRKL